MNAAALHIASTREPGLGRFITLSLVVHVVALVALSVTVSNSIRVSPPQAIQVKLVGIPQPAPAVSKPKPKIEKIRTQDSPAPKEPPKEMKNIPPSQAKTRIVKEELVSPTQQKPTPIEAQQRPPVLDKNPLKKKVVKNDMDAKVVKNPDDFLKALDFVDQLEKKQEATPAKVPTPATAQPAGEGPQLQLNLADQGVVDGIRSHIMQFWTLTPGADVRGKTITINISVDAQGNLTKFQVVRSSGDPSFDNSLSRAIRKAQPLPIPADKFELFRDIELVFEAPQ